MVLGSDENAERRNWRPRGPREVLELEIVRPTIVRIPPRAHMLLAVTLLPVSWNVAPCAAVGRRADPRAALRMLGGFELPKLPKLELGGIEFEAGKETTTMLQTAPGDVQFTDRDGDIITLKPSRTTPGKVDYYNGDVMKIKDASMVQQGEVSASALSLATPSESNGNRWTATIRCRALC